MSLSILRGGRNSTLSSVRAPLTTHLNRAKVVVMAATLVHHVEAKVVEVKLQTGGRRWELVQDACSMTAMTGQLNCTEI